MRKKKMQAEGGFLSLSVSHNINDHRKLYFALAASHNHINWHIVGYKLNE